MEMDELRKQLEALVHKAYLLGEAHGRTPFALMVEGKPEQPNSDWQPIAEEIFDLVSRRDVWE